MSLLENLLRKKEPNSRSGRRLLQGRGVRQSQNKAWNTDCAMIKLVQTGQATHWERSKCRSCSLSHKPRKCPANEKMCFKCKKPNHFAGCCWNKAAVHGLAESNESDTDLDILEQLALVNRVDSLDNKSPSQCIKQQFPNLSAGIGKKRCEYKMVLREDAVPVVQPARRVPHALREPLKEELVRMKDASIIAKVEKPSDWASPLVIVWKKNGKHRACMDPRNVNRASTRQLFQLPCCEEIEGKLARAMYFSCLDKNSGFHHISHLMNKHPKFEHSAVALVVADISGSSSASRLRRKYSKAQ